MTVKGIQKFGGGVGGALIGIAMADATRLYFTNGKTDFLDYLPHLLVVGIGTIVLVLVAISVSVAAIDENTFK